MSIYKQSEGFMRDIVMPVIRLLDPEAAHNVAILIGKYGLIPKSNYMDHPSLTIMEPGNSQVLQVKEEQFFSSLKLIYRYVQDLESLNEGSRIDKVRLLEKTEVHFQGLLFCLKKANDKIELQSDSNHAKANAAKQKLESFDLELKEVQEKFEETERVLKSKMSSYGIISEEELHLDANDGEVELRKITPYRNELIQIYRRSRNELNQMEKTKVEKKKRLADLDHLLNEKLLHATLVRDKIGRLLPNQLYLIYSFGNAYDVGNVKIKLDIVGDYYEAEEYNLAEESGKSKRYRRTNFLEAHPLSILMCIWNEAGAELQIKFHYRPHLKLITVISTVRIPSIMVASSTSEVFCGESILKELFPNDFGIESPIPSNKNIFRKLNIKSYESLVPQLGYAYNWAQKMGSLNYPETDKLCSGNIITKIKKRFIYRVGLETQLRHLEQNILPVIPENKVSPRTSVSKLTKFLRITYEKFCEITPRVEHFIYFKLVNPEDFFYYFTISHPKGVLCASLIIRKAYPVDSPIFTLYYSDNGKFSAEKSIRLESMERALASEFPKLQKHAACLLLFQLNFLCLRFDDYAENRY